MRSTTRRLPPAAKSCRGALRPCLSVRVKDCPPPAAWHAGLARARPASVHMPRPPPELGMLGETLTRRGGAGHTPVGNRRAPLGQRDERMGPKMAIAASNTHPRTLQRRTPLAAHSAAQHCTRVPQFASSNIPVLPMRHKILYRPEKLNRAQQRPNPRFIACCATRRSTGRTESATATGTQGKAAAAEEARPVAVAPNAHEEKGHSDECATSTPVLCQSLGVGKALGPVAFAALTADPGDFESGHFSQLPRGEIGIEYNDD
mmetsp:Transcript_46357/g.96972  ORF Transcript_46357/g.96972 Transcript_46357/m.96972 type:complete len:261 (-) Transcript_46357:1114-1896(-)